MIIAGVDRTVDREHSRIAALDFFQMIQSLDFPVFMDVEIQIQFRIGKVLVQETPHGFNGKIAPDDVETDPDLVGSGKITARVVDDHNVLLPQFLHGGAHRDIAPAENLRQVPQRRKTIPRMQIPCRNFSLDVLFQSFLNSHGGDELSFL